MRKADFTAPLQSFPIRSMQHALRKTNGSFRHFAFRSTAIKKAWHSPAPVLILWRNHPKPKTATGKS
jgi:hypothetical protein